MTARRANGNSRKPHAGSPFDPSRGGARTRPWWLVGAVPCVALAAAWMLGRLVRDEWMWSQMLFWIPGVAAAGCGAAGAAMAWRVRGRTGRVMAVCGAAACVWSTAQVLRSDVGWGFAAVDLPITGSDAESSAIIVHWNPRAPGDRAVDCAVALLDTQADIYVISNPGRMLHSDNAALWVPHGWHVRQSAHVGVVSRWPIEDFDMLMDVDAPPAVAAWMAWARVRVVGGQSIGLLIVDMPSSPQFPRGRVARRVSDALAQHPNLPRPDLLVGDFNSVEGSVLFDAWRDLRAPSAPVSCGWLDTFPRQWPLWRIDWMRAGARLQFHRYETLDLGMGLHRAQRAVVGPRNQPSRPD